MVTWVYYFGILCVILILSPNSSSSQQATDDESGSKNNFATGKPEPSMVVKSGHSEDTVDHYEENPQLPEQHPTLVKEIKAHAQDALEGNQHQDEHQTVQEIGRGMDPLVPPNDILGYKNVDLNDDSYLKAELPTKHSKLDPTNIEQNYPQRNPYTMIIIKGGLHRPRRNIHKRKLLLKRLRLPMHRSRQSNSDSRGEQSSEELLHNILESIDQEDSDGSLIKNAFLTKTTTYNISKLLDDNKNRSFLIEKLVNYSTNLNLLHPENIPTNYSDTRSSVMQTVLHLGQYQKNTYNLEHDEENRKQSDGSSFDKNSLPNDILGDQLPSDLSNENSNTIRTSHERQNHQSPTEFLGGQYLQLPNQSSDKMPKQTNSTDGDIRSADFVGDRFIDMEGTTTPDSLGSNDLKKIPVDFVGGQFLKQLLDSKDNTLVSSSSEFENISGNSDEHQSVTENAISKTASDKSLNQYLLLPTTENVDSNDSEEQASSNVIVVRGNSNSDITQKEDASKSVKLPKNPSGKNNLMHYEGKQNILPENHMNIDIQGPSSFDDNQHAEGTYNIDPKVSVVQTTESETHTENGYESSTNPDEKQNKVEILPFDLHNSDNPGLQIKKKNQIPKPKPMFVENYKTPSKAIGAVPKTVKLTNWTDNNFLRSDINDLKNNNNVTDMFEITTTHAVTLLDDFPFPKGPKSMIQIFNLTKNSLHSFQSMELTEPPEGEFGVASESLHENTQKEFDLKKKDNSSGFILTSDYDTGYRNENDETAPRGSELISSSETEELIDNSKTFLGLNPKKYDGNILKTDSATGKFITEGVESTTQAGSLEELGSVSTIRTIDSDREFDGVIGEASDIQQSKLRSDSLNPELQDQYSSEEQQLSQEQNITGLVDDVELYAGKSTVSEPLEYQTTENYDFESGEIYYNNPVKKQINDSSEENTTVLCITANENYPTLLDLISGKLYWVKDGQKVNLQLKGNPMKSCNSGTKMCKLFFDVNNKDSSISKEIFEVPEDNTDNKYSDSKSKNGKRHITERQASFMEPEQKLEESDEKFIERPEMIKGLSHENTYVIHQSENKSTSNQSLSDYNQTGTLSSTETASSSHSLPIQSMFVRLPTNGFYRDRVENTGKMSNYGQDISPSQTNGEKITLHSLDLPSHRFGLSGGHRLVRKIHQKRDSQGRVGGACGCNNPLLLSPSPIPDYRHFVGKRFSILKNIVHTVKDWVAQDPLRV